MRARQAIIPAAILPAVRVVPAEVERKAPKMSRGKMAGFAMTASVWLAVSPTALRQAEQMIFIHARAAVVWSDADASRVASAAEQPGRATPGGVLLYAGGLSLLWLGFRSRFSHT
jgi:hypothetical protein